LDQLVGKAILQKQDEARLEASERVKRVCDSTNGRVVVGLNQHTSSGEQFIAKAVTHVLSMERARPKMPAACCFERAGLALSLVQLHNQVEHRPP
jgi:hypothetical protein